MKNIIKGGEIYGIIWVYKWGGVKGLDSGLGIITNAKVFYNANGKVFDCGFQPTLVIAINGVTSAGRTCEYYYSENNTVLLNYGWWFHTGNESIPNAITITSNGFVRSREQGGDHGEPSLIVALKIE